MKKESCKNCVHYPGCFTQSSAMFLYFIQTGRERELPVDKSEFNARAFCGPLYKRREDQDNHQTCAMSLLLKNL